MDLVVKGQPLDIAATHLMTPRHESMLVPQVPICGRHLMTRGR
jgi:hypothetical protein